MWLGGTSITWWVGIGLLSGAALIIVGLFISCIIGCCVDCARANRRQYEIDHGLRPAPMTLAQYLSDDGGIRAADRGIEMNDNAANQAEEPELPAPVADGCAVDFEN